MMIGILIALLSGTLMSVQGVFNTEVTKTSGIWVASGFVQLTALIVCVVAWFCTGREPVAANCAGTTQIYVAWWRVWRIYYLYGNQKYGSAWSCKSGDADCYCAVDYRVCH